MVRWIVWTGDRNSQKFLKNVLQKSLLTYEEACTVVTEIESVMNSRPLTYLSKEEYQENLTPNHLIYGPDIDNDRCSSKIEEIKMQSNYVV